MRYPSEEYNLRKPVNVSLKYKLRLMLIPMLARIGRCAGMGWPQIGNLLGREALLSQVGQIKRTQSFISNPSGQPVPQDIIFLTMIGGNAYNASVDVALGLALSARGHRVRFVVCDQALPACEVKKSGKEAEWNTACGKCWAFASKYFSTAGLSVIPVSSLLGGLNKKETSARWNHYVQAALLKHLQVGSIEGIPNLDQKKSAFAQAAEMSAQIGQSIISMNPTRVIMSHGIYSTWGPALELLNEAGIPVVTYGKGKKKHTQKFNWDTSSDWWGVEKEWERVKDIELNAVEKKQINSYLESRKNHSNDTLVYNFGNEELAAETRRRFKLDPAKPTFTLFTNVLWDAASAQREIVFSNPIEWTLETIKWFARHQDRQLIIKIHPAESVIGTRQPFASIIRKSFPELPSNVRMIEPDEVVNSWSILRVTDLGLVHTSTVGMELPLEGVPVACVSRTHYRSKGFTIDVQSRDEYFSLLENWRNGERDIEKDKVFALRYAYLLFERYQLPWNCFYEPNHTDIRAFNFDSTTKLLEDETVNLVVKAIEDKGDFLVPRPSTY
jgi:hypothetical protein